MELGASEKVMVVTGNLSSVPHLQAAAHARLHEQQQQQQQCDKAAGPCPYFRVSFASVGSDEDLVEGFERLRRAVLRCQGGAAANGPVQ
jgi:DNA-binding transcriptional MocR family regulator